MKAYTNIQQSKKLAEILPKESADQTWEIIAIAGANLGVPEEMQYWHNGNTPCILNSKIGIPCWSLAALLDVYPMVVGKDLDMYCCWQNSKNLCSKHYDNPVDAVVELIMKLHEQKLI